MGNIKYFNNFLIENMNEMNKLPMFYSSNFIDLLNSIKSNISLDLLSILNNNFFYPISFIDIKKDSDLITFLPVNRIHRIEGITENDVLIPNQNSIVWGERFRQSIKIGVFISKLLPKYAGTKELENFINIVKGKINSNKYTIKLVKGEEIRFWYLVDNYYNPNSDLIDDDDGENNNKTVLMKSCLKSREKQPFFDIYCNNPNNIGMLIMINKDNLLLARALVWFKITLLDRITNPTKGTLLDRIYYTNESDVNIFIDYANKNGWFYKPRQVKEVYSVAKNGHEYLFPTGNPIPFKTRIENCGEYKYYPYIDTFLYYTPESGRMATIPGKPALNKNGEIMKRYILHSSVGGKKLYKASMI